MKLIILASVIIAGSLLANVIKKHTKKSEKSRDDFWGKELAANNVRKKSLDDLNYVTIPTDRLPFHIMPEQDKVQEYTSIIQALSSRKIVNFTGITNTDLKLTYGTANITVLSEYDENYTTLITTLQKWAKLLYDNNYVEETRTILEYAVSVGSDITATYYLLADIYRAEGNETKIFELIDAASELPGKNGKTIAHTLRESYL